MNVEPLRALRLRTPRLELRLPDEAELVALAELALAGIHPPSEMPFQVPWTDELTIENFVAFHRGHLESWDAADWSLNLVTFVAGEPAGTQGIGARVPMPAI